MSTLEQDIAAAVAEERFERLTSEVRYLRERLARMGERLARLEVRIAQQLSPKGILSEYQTNAPFPFR